MSSHKKEWVLTSDMRYVSSKTPGNTSEKGNTSENAKNPHLFPTATCVINVTQRIKTPKKAGRGVELMGIISVIFNYSIVCVLEAMEEIQVKKFLEMLRSQPWNVLAAHAQVEPSLSPTVCVLTVIKKSLTQMLFLIIWVSVYLKN